MTRFLSESLQAHEPFFRLSLKKLESAHGNPNHDIRLSTDVMRVARQHVQDLGLDAADSTPEEIYHVLQERVRADDARLVKVLRTQAAIHISAEGDVVDGMIHVLQNSTDSKRCYALKASSFKALIKKQPPKKAMKQLGYRSVESLLKHETAVAIMTATRLSEDARWLQRLTEHYKHLTPRDFENRDITIFKPDFKRWTNLADMVVSHRKQNVIGFKELGAVVLLPLPVTAPSGASLASLTIALHEMNEIRAASTFMKLSQMRGDFGGVVQSVVINQPQLDSSLLGRALPWHLVQRYYAQLQHHFDTSLFEPHVQLEDMTWHPVEDSLRAIDDGLNYWQNCAHLALTHHSKPVSFNIMDAAINHCNHLAFEHRVVQYFQHSLWHELLLKYLQPNTLTGSIQQALQPQLVTELAVN